MNRILALMTFLFLLKTGFGQLPSVTFPDTRLHIRFEPNIELLGFAYFLGYEGTNSTTRMVTINGVDIPEKDWQQFGYHLYTRYGAQVANPHLQQAFSLTAHLWLDYLSSFLLQVPSFPEARITPDIPESAWIGFSHEANREEAYNKASQFLAHCNAFYKESGFGHYLDTASTYYQAALNQIVQTLPDRYFVTTMEQFYGQTFDSYTLVPSLTLPKDMGFGPRQYRHDSSFVYSIFGAVDFQRFGSTTTPDMGFGKPDRLRELSIHEFGHSFVNPAIYRLPDSLLLKTAHLFDAVRKAMENQGYNTWRVCVIEHFVRGGEIMIARASGDLETAARLTDQYLHERQFIYLPVILRALSRYHAGVYPTYDDMLRATLIQLAQPDPFAYSGRFSDYPRKALFHTEDIATFWSVYDASAPAFPADALETGYLEKGTPGLRGFIPMRIESSKKLARTIRANRGYYEHIRQSTLSIPAYHMALYAYCEQLQFLYPQAVFPDVYFVIGRNNTGGAVFNGGLIIGAERFGKRTENYSPALSEDQLEPVVIHELIHFQQQYARNNTLLAQCLREGSADFLSELITGKISTDTAIYAYGKNHEEALKQEFLLVKNGTDWSEWLYKSKRKDRPEDLGYWIGYEICKAYYNRATNKQQAIYDMLHITDFEQFLRNSAYL